MAKKKSGDHVFMSYTHSPVIAQFQLLIKDKDGKFPWAQMLDQREMRFVFDMMASVEARKDFTMTPAQAQFGLRILHKLDLSRKHWTADQSAESKKAASASEKKSKGVSTRADLVARRLAKDRLKRAGVTWTKSSPSDVELIEMLRTIGALEQTASRAKAKGALIAWSQAQMAATKKNQL